jgi:hypothetical protein
LTIQEIESALAIAQHLNWITDARKLTDAGLGELDQARRRTRMTSPLPKPDKGLYLPKMLRMA